MIVVWGIRIMKGWGSMKEGDLIKVGNKKRNANLLISLLIDDSLMRMWKYLNTFWCMIIKCKNIKNESIQNWFIFIDFAYQNITNVVIYILHVPSIQCFKLVYFFKLSTNIFLCLFFIKISYFVWNYLVYLRATS